MPLSELKRKQILEILDNILSYRTSAFFDHPVDPVNDQLPNYLKIVKKPMDLGTIRNKIEQNEYDSISSFIADVELVWSNAILFNGRNSMIFNIVRYLQAKFKEQTEFLSDDTRKDWINQMNDLRNKLNNIISNPPLLITNELGSGGIKSHHSTSSIISSASTSSITTTSYSAEMSGSILSSYSTTNLTSHSKSRTASSKNKTSSSSSRSRRKFSSNFSDNDDNEDNEIPSQHNDRKPDNIYYGFDAEDGYDNDDDDEADVSSRWNKKSSSSRSSNKKSNKKNQSKSSSSQKKTNSSSKNKKSSSSQPSSVSSSKSKTDADLTEDEIEKLANDVNQLAADDDKNTEIADLLQKMEPQLSFDEEVGVEKLSMPTLKALQKLVNRLMQI